MKIRRTIKRCLTMCASLLLALLVAVPVPVQAFGMFPWIATYATSQAGADFIKEFEGYRAMAYYDNGKWYIGYGVECDQNAYPMGIDEEQAERLLLEKLKEKEDQLNKLIQENGLFLTQQQFDALASLTYNLGSQWMRQGVRLYDYLLNGIQYYTQDQVINAFGTWCHQGGKVLKNLVNRRLREAYLFLYGQYDNDAPSFYTYVEYDAAGGEVLPSSIFFYPVGSAYGDLPVPTCSGRTFLGWYTDSGDPLTGDEVAWEARTVTASWSGGQVSVPSIDYSSWVNPFIDVSESDWYFPYVRELNYKKIMIGFEDQTFRAESVVSAGEALKLLLVAAGHPDPGNAPSGNWASLYLELAEQLGCVLPGEITDLNAPMDRQTIARVAAIAMGLTIRTGPSPFADTVDPYAVTVYEEGIFEGVPVGGQRYFAPQSSISRAELCAVVSRMNNWGQGAQAPVEVPNDPGVSGYIEYGQNRIPVLPTVPAAPYDKALFRREGSMMYYDDISYRPEVGIDVSRHQGDIDWLQVGASGMVDFALIKLGGQFYGKDNGGLYDDANFEVNLAGARAAGLKVGVYFYSAAVTVEEARQQALYVLEKLDGVPLDYPVAYDWEIYNSSARNAGLTNATSTATDCALAFCETIAAAGYTPMIYVGLDVAYTRLDLSRLTGYDLWFAQYTNRNQPDMYYDYRVWQYSSKGQIPGIEGDVDMNIALIPF